MKMVTVYFPVYAEYSVDVEVPDDKFEEKDFDEAIDTAYNELPSGLCQQCSTGNTGKGWSDRSPVNLELGDSPDVHYIMDDQGNIVWGDPSKKLGW